MFSLGSLMFFSVKTRKALRAEGKEAFLSNAKKEVAKYPPPPPSPSFFQDYLNFKQHYCLSWGR